MNIIEKEASVFYGRLYENGKINNLENLKEYIVSKLNLFNRDRDKLDFLKIIRQRSFDTIEEYKKNYPRSYYQEHREYGIFVIDQEIDEINNSYSHKPKTEDEFTVAEESQLHNRLNDILVELKEQGYAQQIIFEEIEDLKNHFNLGKKNWFQLLKGKVVDLIDKKVLDNRIVQETYNQLSAGYEQVAKMIELTPYHS